MMELLARLDARLRQLDDAHLLRRRRLVGSACAPQMLVDGRPMLSFCSNDYLGLASHPALAAALADGAARYGAGSGASHLVSGHGVAHAQVEERLAAWYAPFIPDARALLFSTGYMANMGLLSALAGPDAEVFSEELNHASLIDGVRLSRARVRVYPHRRTDVLADLLGQSRAELKLVVTDSVFSMDGNLAPLPDLLRLCEKHQAWLVVDDAHGFGVLGEAGRGALSHFALHSPYLVYVGTLGKAAGLSGAFVAAHATVIEWLVQRARQYIFTTASPPALAHALLTSLDLIEGAEGNRRRAQLAALVAQARQVLDHPAWTLGESQTAIQPLVLGENQRALEVAQALQEQGIWVPAIRPPTVPDGTARLRVTLSAAHSGDELARLGEALRIAAGRSGELP